jgi:glycerol-3-phosphate dehydrogenase
VKGVSLDGENVTGVLVGDSSEIISADVVVVTLGPWSDSARKWFPKSNLPTITGMRAHSVVFKDADAPSHALFLDIEGEVGAGASVYKPSRGTNFKS